MLFFFLKLINIRDSSEEISEIFHYVIFVLMVRTKISHLVPKMFRPERVEGNGD